MPLRRIRPEDKSQEWRPRKSVRLSLDDLDAILAVMRQVDNEVKISTADFVGTISEAEELREAGPSSIEQLHLEAGSGERQISVRLSQPVGVRITPRDDFHLVGAAQAIHHLLTARQIAAGGALRSRLTYRLWPLEVGIMAFALTLLVAYLYEGAAGGLPLTGVLLVAGFLATLAMARSFTYGLFSAPNPTPSALIVPAYRAEAPTWWERNRTSVLISLATNLLVTTVVTAVFFLLGLWLA